MPKILHVLASARSEGTTRLVADWLAVKSHVQGVLLLSAEYPEMVAELKDAASGFFQGALRLGQSGSFRRHSVAEAVANACTVFQPEVVVCWPTWAAGVVGMVLRKGGHSETRIIVHCGNPASSTVKEVIVSDIRFWPAYRAKAVFACCSNYVRDSFRRRTFVAKDRFVTVQNCVSLVRIQERAEHARLARKPGGRFRFTMVGTMEGHKDQETLVKAAALLQAEQCDCEVWLVGGGANFARVKALVDRSGLGDRVFPLGSREDVPELLGSSDAFVFSTTREEGFGTVLIEALAAGLPVIASDVPACREALEGGRFGVLVTAQDAPALALAMKRQMVDGKRLGKNAAEVYLRRFSAQTMMDNYLALRA